MDGPGPALLGVSANHSVAVSPPPVVALEDVPVVAPGRGPLLAQSNSPDWYIWYSKWSTTPLGGIGFEGSMIPWATFTACRPTSTHPDCKRCASSSLVIPWLTGTRWICGMLVLHQVVELQGAWHLLPLIQVRNAVSRPCPPRTR